MNIDHYTYRTIWSPEDGEHVGICVEFPSLSWLSSTQEEALAGIRQLVATAIIDMLESGGRVPDSVKFTG